MTKEAAFKQYFSGFGLTAYPSSAVPEDCAFPYLTYDAPLSAWEEGETSLTVNLWDFTTQESPLNAKVRELSQNIGPGGRMLPCDGGFIWLKRGAPFSQALTDEVDPNIKRRYINLTAEYFTSD